MAYHPDDPGWTDSDCDDEQTETDHEPEVAETMVGSVTVLHDVDNEDAWLAMEGDAGHDDAPSTNALLLEGETADEWIAMEDPMEVEA